MGSDGYRRGYVSFAHFLLYLLWVSVMMQFCFYLLRNISYRLLFEVLLLSTHNLRNYGVLIKFVFQLSADTWDDKKLCVIFQ